MTGLPDRRLRIGYVSADFFEHASRHFLLPLMRSHDRVSFEIVCYANVVKPDQYTAQCQALADLWRPIAHLDDEQVASQVRADAIDILIDLKLHTQNSRPLVFARKPAPVQAHWLGYPGTTGLRTIDYRLTDPYLDPQGADEPYSERSIRLPQTYWCYDPLSSEPAATAVPATASGTLPSAASTTSPRRTSRCSNDGRRSSDKSIVPGSSCWRRKGRPDVACSIRCKARACRRIASSSSTP
jgi:predicted O-linked N-acetylglucosamine transferase (SPINDLY family)